MPDNWQDISSANPGCIESVIVFGPETGVQTAWRDSNGQWHCDQWADHCSEIDGLTHWQSLPSPPTDKEPLG